MRKVKPGMHEGAIVIVEVGFNLAKYNRNGEVYGFSEGLRSSNLWGNTLLGNVIAQQGSQARIALIGNWERVDENTIKGELIAGNLISKDWVFKIGESFPVGRRGTRKAYTKTDEGRIRGYSELLSDSTRYAKVIDLYVPEDSPVGSDSK